MNILLTNDDSIYGEGIYVLAKTLEHAGHKVYVAAPDKNNSGKGHSITINDPLRYSSYKLGSENFGYSVTGTPADCVKLGLYEIFKDIKFDLVISGINFGANLGVDLFYSGTYGGASEASLIGIKSIAVSLVINENVQENVEDHFNSAALFTADYIEKIKDVEFPRYTVLNINVPNLPLNKIKGHKYTIQGDRGYRNVLDKRYDPKGRDYFWIKGMPLSEDSLEDTDLDAVNNGYISITPTKLDLTSEEFTILLKKEEKKWTGNK